MKTRRVKEAAAHALRKRPSSDWQKPAVFFAVLALIGGITAATLHLVGDVRHQSLLDFWRIDTGLFPQSTERLLIDGFYGAFDRLIWIQNSTAWSVLAPTVGVFALTVVVLILVLVVFQEVVTSRAVCVRNRGWQQMTFRAFQYFSLAVLASVFVYLLMAISMIFMIIPVAAGDASGRAQALQLRHEYEKGCTASRYRCVEFLRNGDSFAVGFVLESSPSHVALFDVTLRETRVFERGGLEMRSRSSPGND